MAWLGAAAPARGASAASPASQRTIFIVERGLKWCRSDLILYDAQRPSTTPRVRTSGSACKADHASRDTIPPSLSSIASSPAMSKNDSQAPQPPRAERIAHADHRPWRAARRRLPLAARQGRCQGARAPGRRERLHAGGHGAHRGVPGDAVPGDAGAHPGDRHGRALPRGRVRLLLAHRAGQGLPDPVPAPGPCGRARRDHAGSECDGRGPRVLLAGRLRREPRREPAGVLHRRHRLSRVHAAGQGPGNRRRCCRCGSRRRAR